MSTSPSTGRPGRERALIGFALIALVVAAVVTGAVLFSRGVIVEGAGSTPIAITRDDAQSLSAHITLPVSSLTIAETADGLVSGSVAYELPAYAPQVDFQQDENAASLFITQAPQVESDAFTLSAYTSVLGFDPDIPLALTLDQGQGAADLRLSPLTLTALDARFGIGQHTIAIEGEQPIFSTLRVASDEGADTVNMNCACASLLSASLDLGRDADRVVLDGAYPLLNTLTLTTGAADDSVELVGTYPALVSSFINLGDGSDTLTLAGAFNPNSNLIIDIGTGNDVVSLDGTWTGDATLTLISEGDTTSVALPTEVGVFVEVASRGNVVNAPGFTEQDGGYVNAAFGVSPITLRVNINTTPNEVVTLTLGGAAADATPEAAPGG
jgi:hypothetical protein